MIWKRYILLVDVFGELKLFNTIPGVIQTEAGRANGTSKCLDAPYDGYAECVKIHFDPAKLQYICCWIICLK